ncbi:hypothetical protein ONR07_24355, partial [Salmonella enterica subsp. enterica serovar Anatum]|nr:hypothetical protein [Salmonella enterica subsp. enterica serovar Anatum]
TTADHMHMLFRATNNVICCYDGDRAGRDAAWRALETAMPYMTSRKNRCNRSTLRAFSASSARALRKVPWLSGFSTSGKAGGKSP